MTDSTALVGTAQEYADMFDLAPVSLWLEDYSELKRLFARWRADGITDLRAWLREPPERVAECSRCLRVLKVNRRTLELYRAHSLEHLVANLDRVFRDDMFDRHVEELVALWEGRAGFRSETVNYTLDGRRLDLLINATILPGHEEDWSRLLLSIEDITARRQAEREAMHAEQYARGLFEHSPVSLWVEDFSAVRELLEEVRQQGIMDFRTFIDVHPEFVLRCMQEIRVIDVNQQTLTLFGAPDKHTLLRRLDDVLREEMQAHFAEQLVELWNHKLFQQRETVNYRLDGQPVHVLLQFSVLPGHEATWDLVLISLTDITARKQAEAYLEFLGKHDALTKLRNRSYYTDELTRLQRKGPFPVAVVVLDLNGLKPVNDQLGHAAGDALLRRAGEVLNKAVDRHACAARIGGDEFALLLPGTDEAGGQAVIEDVLRLVEINNQFYPGAPLSFSIGMAVCRSGDLLEATVIEADSRMYDAKRAYYTTARRDRRKQR